MGKNKRKYPDQSEEDKARKKLAKLQSKAGKGDGPEVQEIKKKAAEVVESRKNSNNILEIINHLDLEEAGNTAAAAIKALKRIFTIAIEKHELGDEAEEKQELSADDKTSNCINYPTETFKSYDQCDQEYIRKELPEGLIPFWSIHCENITLASNKFSWNGSKEEFKLLLNKFGKS